MAERITHEWLRWRGFRLTSHHQDVKPHMVKTYNHRSDCALEVSEWKDNNGFTEWHVWLRSDLAHSRCRFVFVRMVSFTDQMERLWEALTDSLLAHEEYNPETFAESLNLERADCERRYAEYAKGERYGHIPG